MSKYVQVLWKFVAILRCQFEIDSILKFVERFYEALTFFLCLTCNQLLFNGLKGLDVVRHQTNWLNYLACGKRHINPNIGLESVQILLQSSKRRRRKRISKKYGNKLGLEDTCCWKAMRTDSCFPNDSCWNSNKCSNVMQHLEDIWLSLLCNPSCKVPMIWTNICVSISMMTGKRLRLNTNAE